MTAWEFTKKYCPIRRLCFWSARQFVEFAEFLRVLVDFYSGKGCNRSVKPIDKN